MISCDHTCYHVHTCADLAPSPHDAKIHACLSAVLFTEPWRGPAYRIGVRLGRRRRPCCLCWRCHGQHGCSPERNSQSCMRRLRSSCLHIFLYAAAHAQGTARRRAGAQAVTAEQRPGNLLLHRSPHGSSRPAQSSRAASSCACTTCEKSTLVSCAPADLDDCHCRWGLPRSFYMIQIHQSCLPTPLPVCGPICNTLNTFVWTGMLQNPAAALAGNAFRHKCSNRNQAPPVQRSHSQSTLALKLPGPWTCTW